MATFILNPNPPTAASCPVQHRQDPGLHTFQAPPATLAPLGGCFPSLAPGTRPHPAQATEVLKLPVFLAAPYLYSPLEAASVSTHISTAKDETLQTFLSVPTGPSVSTLTVAFLHTRKLVNQPGHFPLPSFQPWTCSSKSSIYMPSYKVQLLPKQRGKSAAFMILQ